MISVQHQHVKQSKTVFSEETFVLFSTVASIFYRRWIQYMIILLYSTFYLVSRPIQTKPHPPRSLLISARYVAVFPSSREREARLSGWRQFVESLGSIGVNKHLFLSAKAWHQRCPQTAKQRQFVNDSGQRGWIEVRVSERWQRSSNLVLQVVSSQLTVWEQTWVQMLLLTLACAIEQWGASQLPSGCSDLYPPIFCQQLESACTVDTRPHSWQVNHCPFKGTSRDNFNGMREETVVPGEKRTQENKWLFKIPSRMDAICGTSQPSLRSAPVRRMKLHPDIAENYSTAAKWTILQLW